MGATAADGAAGSSASGQRTGDAGALASLFSQADLALVNLESPEPNDFTYHADGFSFTGDPALLAGVQHAGIDAVSLANNHLGDGGTHGVADTIDRLDQLGIAHSGAGANRSEARQAACVSRPATCVSRCSPSRGSSPLVLVNRLLARLERILNQWN